MKIPTLRLDVRIALTYATIGVLWILISDRLLAALLTDFSTLNAAQTYKGWAFVAVSTLVIFLLLRRELELRTITEGRLEESEERYRQLYDNSLDAILLTSPEGSIYSANPAACSLFAWSQEELQALGRNGLVVVSDPRLQPALEERVRTGKFHGELAFLRGDGTTFEGELSTSVFRDRDGSQFTSMMVRDVTERKKAEATLHQSQERYRTLVEISPNAILIHSDNRITFINHSGLKILGATQPEQILGKAAFEILHPDYQAPIQQRIEVMLREKKPMELTEAKIIQLNGTTRDVDVGATSFEEHGVTAIQVIMWDITERKLADEDLRQTHLFLSTLLEVAPASIYVMSLDDKFILVNSQWEKDTRTNRSDVLGHSIDEIFPNPLAQKYKQDNRQVSQTNTVLATEEWAETRNGYRCFFTVKFPLQNSTGQVDKVGGISFDITERKEMEEELRIRRNRLAVLSRQLVQAHEKERRAIGRELHDQIGQMLTAMQITLDLAQRLPVEESTKKLAQAQELTGELLQRISRISLELRPSMLDDLGLLSALLWHVNKYQVQTGIQVDFRHSGVEDKRFVPEIETTAYRIVQEALTNVVRHAQARQVRLEIRAGAGQLEIRIQDDGKGFDPQAALAENRGLSGMHERVQLVDGTFQIDSEPGVGTKVLIQLPIPEDMP